MTALPDRQHRELALDVGNSFIVQAPAGSGKTELLSLRYLSLLGRCDEPEEVLAITFTRKAASEMKQRIIKALRSVQVDSPDPEFRDELEERRYRIASAALQRSRQRNWNLLANPGRLKIQTIDSFCFSLASRIPLLSQLGGTPNVSDDVRRCFGAAITDTLALLNEDSPLSADIELLLSHLDNDVGVVEKLLANLLANRDQWLPHVLEFHGSSGIDRHYLQSALDELIRESLQEVRTTLLAHQQDLVELLNFAACHLPESHHRYSRDYQPLSQLPAADADAMAYWLMLEAMLLTKADGDWRSRIDKREGFPAAIDGDRAATALCKQRKQQWQTVLEALRNDEELRQALVYVRLLPDPSLEDRQWQFLAALARILRQLSVRLLLAFRQFRMVDHTQVSAAALNALGPEDEPTDLALALDHRIQHILVDEFQDTSTLQTDLLEQLTAGWQPGDGRTLFLVGDAMQSVYGFRNANVGIYLKVREQGLGDVPMQALTLQSNFRSQAAIVNWVNRVFVSAFPGRASASHGAVPYTPSVAHKPALEGQGISAAMISYQPQEKEAALRAEARLIAQRVLTLREAEPDDSIAILVRNRSHLASLIPALRAAGVRWQATDIDRLDSLPVIDDLQSLTRAILNPGDRIAWLAVLRAPWCGLSLADLHAISRTAGERSLWTALKDIQSIEGLSADARVRLEDFIKVLDYLLARRGQHPLHQLVEAAWTLLRGGALALSEVEQASVAYYLRLLQEHEVGGSLPDYQEFSARVAAAYVPSRKHPEEGGAVHLMTMHKAKGLEFDHVILPALGAASRSNDKALLQWHERVNAQGDSRLFLAALSPSGADDDPLYQLLRFEEKRKSDYEDVRLLYIATTRARKSALLTATLAEDSTGEAAPRKGSLLYHIWPQLQELGEAQYRPAPLQAPGAESGVAAAPGPGAEEARLTLSPIQRFREPLRLHESELRFMRNPASEEEPETGLAHGGSEDEYSALIGTLIHQALENLVSNAGLLDEPQTLANLRNYWHSRLLAQTDGQDGLTDALTRIEETLRRCRESSACAWVFDPQLEDSRTEAPVSLLAAGKLYHYVVDRTFIDSQGNRWVIDYKTASPTAGESTAAFIARQRQLHEEQLRNYRRLFEQLDARPVRSALLLTSIAELVEVD